MEQMQSFAYDMATMSLKGKRFREAEQQFKELAMQENSVEAWCGMALSKFGLLLEDVTLAEVFFCFDKANAIVSEENKQELITVVQQSSFECANQLYNLYTKAVLATRSAAHRKSVAVLSTIVSGFSAMNSLNRNNTIGAIAMAGFAALSYEDYLKAHSSAEELKQVQSHVVKLIEELKEYVKAFLGAESDKWKEFVLLTERKQQNVIENLKTDDQKAYENAMAENKSQAAQGTGNFLEQLIFTKPVTMPESERVKYIEEKSEELKDEKHPFHLVKAEAMRLFQARKYSSALKFANLAATYFSEDPTVKMIQDKALKRYMRPLLFIMLPIWLVISLSIGVSTDSKNGGLILLVTGIPFLIFLMWKGNQLKTTCALPIDVKTKQISQTSNQ